jgi:hypothetical protein
MSDHDQPLRLVGHVSYGEAVGIAVLERIAANASPPLLT